MPKLVIDIRNTRIKSAIFKKVDLKWKAGFDEIVEALESWVGTNRSISNQKGNWYEMRYGLTGQFQAFTKEYPEINVFVCRGDAQSFVSLAKDHIFVVPNLVLHGLNCILNHNVE